MPEIPPRRILVVEDHEAFRRILCSLVAGPEVLVDEAADGLVAIEQAAAHTPDLVVLDIGLPGVSGLEVTRRLPTIAPRAKIILVTNETSADVIEEAFRRGAHGYVHKPRTLRDLLPAIAAAMAAV